MSAVVDLSSRSSSAGFIDEKIDTLPSNSRRSIGSFSLSALDSPDRDSPRRRAKRQPLRTASTIRRRAPRGRRRTHPALASHQGTGRHLPRPAGDGCASIRTT